MAEPTARDAASAVAAVLAVTPTWEGEVLAADVRPGTGGPNAAAWCDPTPIAARQAAAVLRWAAGKLAAEDDRTEMETGQRLYGTADYRVRGLADEIDGGTDE